MFVRLLFSRNSRTYRLCMSSFFREHTTYSTISANSWQGESYRQGITSIDGVPVSGSFRYQLQVITTEYKRSGLLASCNERSTIPSCTHRTLSSSSIFSAFFFFFWLSKYLYRAKVKDFFLLLKVPQRDWFSSKYLYRFRL